MCSTKLVHFICAISKIWLSAAVCQLATFARCVLYCVADGHRSCVFSADLSYNSTYNWSCYLLDEQRDHHILYMYTNIVTEWSKFLITCRVSTDLTGEFYWVVNNTLDRMRIANYYIHRIHYMIIDDCILRVKYSSHFRIKTIVKFVTNNLSLLLKKRGEGVHILYFKYYMTPIHHL